MKIKFKLARTVLAETINPSDNGYINTVVQATNKKLDGGTAVKLDHHVRQVYSKEIEYKVMPNLIFHQFAKIKTELGTQPGLSIQMMTYNNLKNEFKLEEGVRIKPQAMSSEMKEIKVAERGTAVSVSELALRSSFTDIMNDATTLLARHLALALDSELRDTAVTGASNEIYGRKKGAKKVASKAEITPENPLTVATIKDAVELLATNNTPKYGGTSYICILHPHQSRDLRDDPAWINASNYGNPELLFNGEIGKIDDVRFIETTILKNGAASKDEPAFDATLKGAEDIPAYSAILFGDEFYGLARAMGVELRDNGVVDFGRERALAWYSIWGTGVLNPERGVRIITA